MIDVTITNTIRVRPWALVHSHGFAILMRDKRVRGGSSLSPK